MTNPVTCDECRHFERDTINPAAGIGLCRHPRPESHHSSHYPSAPHYCRRREEFDDAAE